MPEFRKITSDSKAFEIIEKNNDLENILFRVMDKVGNVRFSVSSDGTLVGNFNTLAVGGQVPAQEPVGGSFEGSTGSLPVSARADHSHPFTPLTCIAGIGEYIDNGFSTSGSQPPEAREMAVLMNVPFTMTFDQIGTVHQSNGSSGAVLRFGVRKFQPSNPSIPGTLEADLGTMDATTGATGPVTKTINKTLTAGLWWITVTAQGGAVTRPTVHYPSHPYLKLGPSVAATRWYTGKYQDSVTGALPTNWNGGQLENLIDNLAPYVILRRGA